jgi:hypothetical protein
MATVSSEEAVTLAGLFENFTLNLNDKLDKKFAVMQDEIKAVKNELNVQMKTVTTEIEQINNKLGEAFSLINIENSDLGFFFFNTIFLLYYTV